MSRLSKRTTYSPRAASCSQKSSCQQTICVPRPMISSAVGSDRLAEGLVAEGDPAADVAELLGTIARL